MRKILLFILVSGLCIPCVFGGKQAAVSRKTVSINCRVEGVNSFDRITFNKVADGADREMMTWRIDGTGCFSFGFVPEYEGIYTVTVGSDLYSYPVYIKEGDTVNFRFSDDGLELEGRNTPENEKLYEWERMSAEVRNISVNFESTSVTYTGFFPLLEALAVEKENFKKGINTRNGYFNEYLRDFVDYSLDYFAVTFIYTPRTEHAPRTKRSPYYSTIQDPAKFETDRIMEYPFGGGYLSHYPYLNFEYKGVSPPLEEFASVFPNDRLKVEFLLNSPYQIKTYGEFLGLMALYRPVMTPDQIHRMETFGATLYETREGAVAADFTYPNPEGDLVSLSDFRGKVVLIDVWATWCGPCIKEIPHLKELERDFHGSDVVFMSVSLDEEKYHAKWKEFIEREELGGVQLFADGWSHITKSYDIKSIPRFIVIDREGNIVSPDAPRPSDPRLRTMIEEELAK